MSEHTHGGGASGESARGEAAGAEAAKGSATPTTNVVLTAIDCHAHVMEIGRPLSPISHSSPKSTITVAQYMDVLNRFGISHGLLTAPSFYGSDNSLLLEALASEPERLRGTAIVEPDIKMAELKRLKAQGICGVRLNWIKRDELPDASSGDYQNLFAMVRELDLHIELFLEGELMRSVLPLIRRSGVHVVLDHFGCPDPELGVRSEGFKCVLEAVGAGNTWVKLSAPYRLRGANPQAYVDALLAAGGPERLMWATDWPWVGFESVINYQQCIDWLTLWVPDDHVRGVILRDTPHKLFWNSLSA